MKAILHECLRLSRCHFFWLQQSFLIKSLGRFIVILPFGTNIIKRPISLNADSFEKSGFWFRIFNEAFVTNVPEKVISISLKISMTTFSEKRTKWVFETQIHLLNLSAIKVILMRMWSMSTASPPDFGVTTLMANVIVKARLLTSSGVWHGPP